VQQSIVPTPKSTFAGIKKIIKIHKKSLFIFKKYVKVFDKLTSGNSEFAEGEFGIFHRAYSSAPTVFIGILW
jgi:hypothetical protein